MSIMNSNLRQLKKILEQHQPVLNGCSGCDWKDTNSPFSQHQFMLVKHVMEEVWNEAYSDGQADESHSWASSGASNDGYRYTLPRMNPYK